MSSNFGEHITDKISRGHWQLPVLFVGCLFILTIQKICDQCCCRMVPSISACNRTHILSLSPSPFAMCVSACFKLDMSLLFIQEYIQLKQIRKYTKPTRPIHTARTLPTLKTHVYETYRPKHLSERHIRDTGEYDTPIQKWLLLRTHSDLDVEVRYQEHPHWEHQWVAFWPWLSTMRLSNGGLCAIWASTSLEECFL